MLTSEAEDGEAVPAESAEQLGRPVSDIVLIFVFDLLPRNILSMCLVGKW